MIAGRATASEHTAKIAVPVLVAGATGLVGSTIVRLLEERNFPVKQLIPAASERSAGSTVLFRGKAIPVTTLEQALKTEPGIALFSAGGAVSKTWIPLFVEKGWQVVDNSSYWRMDEHVPLVVPEINGHLLQPSCQLQPSHQSQPSCPLQPSQQSQPSCPLQPSHQSQPSCPLQPSHQSQPSCQLQPSHQSQPSCPLQPSHQSQPSCPLQPSHRLVANPNCSTIQMVMALAPLHNAFGLQRVVATTYQSVSGSGRKGEKQLNRERAQARQTQLQAKHTQQIQPLHKHAPAPQPQYEYQSENAQTDTAAQTSRQPSSYHANLSSEQISFHLQCRQPSSYHADPASPYHCPIDLNVIPQIGDFLEDGYSEEEHKMIDETKKIFNDSSIGVSATTVRVPVFGAHCVSLNVQLARPFTLEEVHRLLSSFPGLVLTDAPEGPTQLYGPGLRPGLVPGEEPAMKYATPLTAKGTDAIYVSRVRRDPSIENGLELWTVADNIRKGAALNAVQIAEHLLTLKGSK